MAPPPSGRAEMLRMPQARATAEKDQGALCITPRTLTSASARHAARTSSSPTSGPGHGTAPLEQSLRGA